MTVPQGIEPAARGDVGAMSAESTPLLEDRLVVPVPMRWHGPRSMPGDITELTDGRLLLAYDRQEYWTDGKPSGLYARISGDRGARWEEEFPVLLDPPGGRVRYAHPTFLRLANSELLMCYIRDTDVDPGYGHTYCRRSRDDGQTWGEQFIITPHNERTLVHNDKLVLLSDGRIIAPAEFSPGAEYGSHHSYVATAFYSDEDGYEWRISRNVVSADYEVQEPHVVELTDGRLMMMFRTYSGFCGRAWSDDRGESWSKPEAVHDLPMTPRASAITVDRIPATGDLLLLRCRGWGEDERGRTPFVSAISTDEGRTWGRERIIAGDRDNDYGYQSVDFVDDLAVISYHHRDGLHVARIGIDWFYAADA